MPLTDCLLKNKFLKPGEKANITKRAETLTAQGMNAKEAELQAAKSLQRDILQSISDIHQQVGITPPGERQPPASPPREPHKPGERETIIKLQEQSTLDQELKEGIEQFKAYEIKKRDRTQKNAKAYIDRVGEDQALDDASNPLSWKTQLERLAILSELAERFNAKFHDSKDLIWYDKYMRAMAVLAENITDHAQALSYMNLVGEMFKTKTGAVRFATRQIDESRHGALENHKEMKFNAQEIVEAFDNLSKEEFLQSEKVQQLIKDLKKPKTIQQNIANKRLKDAKDNLKKILAEAGNVGIVWDPKSQAKQQVKLTNALIDYIQALIKKLMVDTGEAAQRLTDEVKKSVKEFATEIGFAIQDADLNSVIKEQIDEVTDKGIKKKFKGDIKQAMKDFVTKKSSFNDLIAHIAQEEELTTEEAKELADRFKKVFDEYATKEKQKLVKKYLPKKKVDRKRTEFYDKVINLSNAGAVSDKQMDDVIATIFGLPKMTPEIVQRIEELVDDINKAPDGRFKNIAITNMTDYIAQQQKFNVSDYMLASFRAGIFSGMDTQSLNLTGNFTNVLELGFMLSITNPMAGARFIASVKNPTSLSRAALEALQIMRTGFDPRVAGDAKRRVLEHSPRSFLGIGKPLPGWTQAFDPTLEQMKKFVFRMLNAGDILFQTGINDALQGELMVRAAAKIGLKGKAAREYIREQMGFTPENIKKALEQAQKEAANHQIPSDNISIALRSKEIIEQKRDPKIVARSRAYAAKQIMTNTPDGWTGIITRAINSVISQIKIVGAIIPVVNFAGNAMQRGMQYVPPIAAARGLAKYIARRANGEHFSTMIKADMQNLKNGDFDMEMRLRRFAVGTVGLALMMVLLDDDEEGDNKLSKALGKIVKIHGGGPGTKFNRQKTYQKTESGYLPYSIQIGDTYIPYKNWPGLSVFFASWGEYQDAKRYHKLSEKDALDRIAFALGGAAAIATEQGYLSSINSAAEALMGNNPKKLVDLAARPVTGFLFPKFQRNLVNLFDPQVYSANDVKEMVLRSLPVANSVTGEPLLNALGEPIERYWWDRIALWNTKSHSQYQEIWKRNSAREYYISVPSRYNLEQLFDGKITTKDYNQFLINRGKEIVSEFNNEKETIVKLNNEDYNRKMDRIVEHAAYKALVKMGVSETDLMKEIRYELYDINESQRDTQKLRKDLKP